MIFEWICKSERIFPLLCVTSPFFKLMAKWANHGFRLCTLLLFTIFLCVFFSCTKYICNSNQFDPKIIHNRKISNYLACGHTLQKKQQHSETYGRMHIYTMKRYTLYTRHSQKVNSLNITHFFGKREKNGSHDRVWLWDILHSVVVSVLCNGMLRLLYWIAQKCRCKSVCMLMLTLLL